MKQRNSNPTNEQTSLEQQVELELIASLGSIEDELHKNGAANHSYALEFACRLDANPSLDSEQRESNRLWAQLLRDRSNPGYIRNEIATCRLQLETGQLTEARASHRQLQMQLEGMRQTLRRLQIQLDAPARERGEKILAAAKQGHAKVYGTPEEIHDRYATIYEALLAEVAKGTKQPAVAVAAQYGVSRRMVDRARKKMEENPTKV